MGAAMSLDRFVLPHSHAQRGLSDGFRETELALVAWGSWRRNDEPPNAPTGITTLARAIRQQAEGASQPGAPNDALIDFLTAVDRSVAGFVGIDARLIRIRWVYHPDWPREAICRRLNMSGSSYDRRLRGVRDAVRTAVGLDLVR